MFDVGKAIMLPSRNEAPKPVFGICLQEVLNIIPIDTLTASNKVIFLRANCTTKQFAEISTKLATQL